MRRSSRLVACVGLALSILAPAALAGPPALEHVPSGSMVVLTSPSLARLHKNAGAFIKAVEAPIPMPELDEILMQMGFEANKGFDASNGSIAIAFIPPTPNADGSMPDEPDPSQMMVVVVQSTGYADFISNFDGKPDAASGIATGLVTGSDAFFKDLGGGFVAMAQSKETLARADWKPVANAGAGKSCQTVIDSSDLSVVVFPQRARQFLPKIREAIEDQMANNPMGAAMDTMPFEQILTGPMAEQCSTMVAGFRADTMGMTIDMAADFTEGSEMAQMLSGINGSSAQLLSKLPSQPYLFAMAMDMSSPGARTLIDGMVEQMGALGQDAVTGFMSNCLKNSDGAAVTIGMPPGGLMTGLFTSTIGYVKTSNPDAFIENMKTGLTNLNGQSMQGLAMETSFQAGANEVEGTKLDTWGIKIKADENADDDMGQVAMAIPMIFGQAGGPGGYLARANGGLFQTFGKNSALIGNAIKAGAGGDNLMSDKLLAKVAEQLPKNRVAEFYIGVKGLLDSALPLMAMGGIAVETEIPPSLPPIGFGMASGNGGAHMAVYLPAQTLKTVVEIGLEVQKAQMGEDDFGPDEGNQKGPKKGAGQPRF